MTTIPIEVIVQDAEAPIVPSEDGTNTNTNAETAASVAVPDTGEGDGGIFTGSASAVVLPVILLVLALGTIVAILIHKHNRQKHTKNETKISKKEKLAMVATSTVAVLAATVLVSNLVLPATKAATNTDTNSISPAENIITITIDKGETLESSAASTAYATVATTFGYEILLAASSSTANLYLDGDVTSKYYIAPTESAELGANTWGYSLEEGVDYEEVPLADNAALITKGTEVVENEEFNVYYGAKVSEELPAGTYKGEIEYILSDTGFPYALRTMQNMTTEICESAPTPNAFKADGTTIEDIVPTATLTDIRDNKTYTIAKLADGKCWMTKNLDLQKEDLLAGVTLDATNTDHPAAGFVLPDSQNSGSESWGDDETAINTAHIYDTANNGETYYSCLEYQPWGPCATYSETPIPPEDLGNLYNWYSATAGTGTYSLETGNATGSICPAGWRLAADNRNSGGVADYGILLSQYGITSSPMDAQISKPEYLLKAPLSFVKAGMYSTGAISVGEAGRLWLSSAFDAINAGYLAFGKGNFINVSSKKNIGSPTRCIAQ